MGCPSCGAALRPEARFCASCGATSPGERAARARRSRDETRAIASIAACFLGTLAVLILLSLAIPDTFASPGLAGPLALTGGLVAVAGLGIALLPRGDRLGALGQGPGGRWLLLAVPVAAGALAVSYGYVAGLQALLHGEVPGLTWQVPVGVVAVAVLPALSEELLCRGVLWRGCQRLMRRTPTLVVTAALFAFLHGLEGAVFSFPHRFVAGLGFGWLRLRSGSLGPPILAHFLHNLGSLTLIG